MTMDCYCKLLEWDTKFFGIRIATTTDTVVNKDSMDAILSWCLEHKIECLYFMANACNTESTMLAEKSGFNLFDIRVALEKSMGGPTLTAGLYADEELNETFTVRPACDDDIPFIHSYSKSIFLDSRFRHDTRFPKDRVDAMYVRWVDNHYRKPNRDVLVLAHAGAPKGFIACGVDNDGVGNIGLVGVDSCMQLTWAATYMLNQAFLWFEDKGVEKINVVTQGRNVKALRFYHRGGFLPTSMHLWYHKWFVGRT